MAALTSKSTESMVRWIRLGKPGENMVIEPNKRHHLINKPARSSARRIAGYAIRVQHTCYGGSCRSVAALGDPCCDRCGYGAERLLFKRGARHDLGVHAGPSNYPAGTAEERLTSTQEHSRALKSSGGSREGFSVRIWRDPGRCAVENGEGEGRQRVGSTCKARTNGSRVRRAVRAWSSLPLALTLSLFLPLRRSLEVLVAE